MMLKVDRLPSKEADPQDRHQALSIYRKITALRVSPCCGMCGTTRHATKPFWTLGMRLCKYCVQANLVSNIVLYHRYWVAMDRAVQGHVTFVDAVVGDVFYFSECLTPLARMDYSIDPIDFPGGKRNFIFFWKPHLAKLFDLDLLAKEAAAKHGSAALIKGLVRRSLVLRLLTGLSSHPEKTKEETGASDDKQKSSSKTKNKEVMIQPTTLVSFTPPSSGDVKHRRKDPRVALFRLHRISLLDTIDWYDQHRVMTRLKLDLASKLERFEDRLLVSAGHF
jgi:hypothetical protein